MPARIRPERRGLCLTPVSACLPIIGLLAAGELPAQHATAFDVQDGKQAYENVCANCHGPDGDLIAGIDLGRGLFRRPLGDEQLVEIIMNGIPDTPMPPTPGMNEAQAEQIVAYLRANAATRSNVAATGDPARGRDLFEGRGACLDCHRVNGVGSGYGPDLSGIGLQRRAAELEASLLEPDAEVQAANRSYSVTTADGEIVTGRLLNHDTFTVQLIDYDEKLRSFQKEDLRDYRFVASTMPSYRDEFDTQEIADVVSYMISLRAGQAR